MSLFVDVPVMQFGVKGMCLQGCRPGALGGVGGSGSRPIETHRSHKRFSAPVMSLPVCMFSGVWRKSEIIQCTLH